MNRQTTLALATSLLIALSGCGGSTINVDFQGNTTTSNEKFSMNGHITEESRASPKRLENVTVYLYADNETILNSTSFESIEGGESSEFTLTSSERPKYIIINSPNFWSFDNPNIEYYVWQNGVYSPHIVGNQNELPIKPDSN